jgi:hypothetical protein
VPRNTNLGNVHRSKQKRLLNGGRHTSSNRRNTIQPVSFELMAISNCTPSRAPAADRVALGVHVEWLCMDADMDKIYVTDYEDVKGTGCSSVLRASVRKIQREKVLISREARQQWPESLKRQQTLEKKGS